MLYTPLGTTGIDVSRIAFGAGPVAGLMTADQPARQLRLVERSLEAGVNWFDTAATYGDGQSERSLGAALASLGVANKVNVATKVRLMPQHLGDIAEHVSKTVMESLKRLQIDRITLLQIHNAITAERGDESTSITPHDVLSPGGVLEAMRQLRDEGLVRYLGITAIGQADALRQVISSGEFDTIQTPYSLVNPSSGRTVSVSFPEVDYGNIAKDCAQRQMGVFAIRVFAGGALVDNPPSEHTYKTKFFPLDLYYRDEQRAEELKALLPEDMALKEAAVRFVLSHPQISSAIIGFGQPEQIDEVLSYFEAGPLPTKLVEKLIGAL